MKLFCKILGHKWFTEKENVYMEFTNEEKNILNIIKKPCKLKLLKCKRCKEKKVIFLSRKGKEK